MHQRANTPERKRDAVEALLAAWLRCPQLRLGQLVDVAMNGLSTGACVFYVEDDELTEAFKRIASEGI